MNTQLLLTTVDDQTSILVVWGLDATERREGVAGAEA